MRSLVLMSVSGSNQASLKQMYPHWPLKYQEQRGSTLQSQMLLSQKVRIRMSELNSSFSAPTVSGGITWPLKFIFSWLKGKYPGKTLIWALMLCQEINKSSLGCISLLPLIPIPSFSVKLGLMNRVLQPWPYWCSGRWEIFWFWALQSLAVFLKSTDRKAGVSHPWTGTT